MEAGVIARSVHEDVVARRGSASPEALEPAFDERRRQSHSTHCPQPAGRAAPFGFEMQMGLPLAVNAHPGCRRDILQHGVERGCRIPLIGRGEHLSQPGAEGADLVEVAIGEAPVPVEPIVAPGVDEGPDVLRRLQLVVAGHHVDRVDQCHGHLHRLIAVMGEIHLTRYISSLLV